MMRVPVGYDEGGAAAAGGAEPVEDAGLGGAVEPAGGLVADLKGGGGGDGSRKGNDGDEVDEATIAYRVRILTSSPYINGPFSGPYTDSRWPRCRPEGKRGRESG